MAVPVPTSQALRHFDKSSFSNFEKIQLYYPQKKTEIEILKTAAGMYNLDSQYFSGENFLFHAENLKCLAFLRKTWQHKIKVIYIDPPYATEGAFTTRNQSLAYEDYLSGADFLEHLRSRLLFLHQLLSNDGSLYLHIDARMVFYCRILLDEIFGVENFRACITRRKCNPKNSTRKTYGNISDYILFYSKSDKYTWNRPVEHWTEEKAKKEYPCIDENGRRYKKVPIHAPGTRNGETGKPWRGKMPPLGKHWQYTPDTLEALDKKGEIYWSGNGNPRRKVYLENSAGIPIQDIWLDVKDADNQNSLITGYPTEKNPLILQRIIEASSNKGDMVLDCYAGSGTTLAVAGSLDRRWIGIDQSAEAIKTIQKRLTFGCDRMGDFVEKPAQIGNLSLFSELPVQPLGMTKRLDNYQLWHEVGV
jgi:adenine-specific DNA-methyltransferase